MLSSASEACTNIFIRLRIKPYDLTMNIFRKILEITIRIFTTESGLKFIKHYTTKENDLCFKLQVDQCVYKLQRLHFQQGAVKGLGVEEARSGEDNSVKPVLSLLN